MLQTYKLWDWVSWPVIKAHLCSLAIGVTFNSTWRLPRGAHLYGAVPYGLLVTAALLVLALPLTLLQLAVGQLSQQDAVGVWRAVPFFRGVGYIRLLVSFLGLAYSAIYLALTLAYFLYTATHNIPFVDCVEMHIDEEETYNAVNASQCLSNTFMSPLDETPQYYLAIALIIISLWIVSPFVFYKPVKFMKRILYIMSPVVVILAIIIVSCVGDSTALSSFKDSNWLAFGEPYLWMNAVVQSLWSNQVAGGYIICAGDSVYASTNVQWSSLAITSINILSVWLWLVFWCAISGTGVKDTSVAAVLVQTYQAAEERDLQVAWPLLVFLTLIMSGVITMLVLLYPLYDRLRRAGGVKWRVVSFASALIGAGVSLAILAGNLPTITLVEDVAVPLMICVATILEILAFGLIYGWRNLVEDVEFLIGSELLKYWVWGWFTTAAVISSVLVWWVAAMFIDLVMLVDPPWEAATVVASISVTGVLFVVCATVAVSRQVHYDMCEKLKASFQPTRHWGPRDPITHYYWLARRDVDRGSVPQTRYSRRELGQLSRRPSFLTVTDYTPSISVVDFKPRSNSDDWLYTTRRKQYLGLSDHEKKRSKSLDWDVPIKVHYARDVSRDKEDNNNTIGFQHSGAICK